MFKFVLVAALAASVSATQPRLDGRIVGGVDADISEYPYQLSLQSHGRHICGASIISSKYAVTAAHCTDGSSASSLSVVAGISNLRDEGQRLQVRQIHQHPKFSMSTIDYDISVLELQGEIELDGKRQVIRLASEGSDPVEGTDVVVTGWGTTREGGSVSNQLQTVGVQIVDREVCREQYAGENISTRMVCAGVARGGKDACQGDSGGPLVADGRLVGIVSWGYGCARPGLSGIYSNVGALRSFVTESVGI